MMIVSDLEHIERQALMTASLRKAFEFLRSPGLPGLPDGRVELDGSRVFALVQRYETAMTDAPKFEAHRKYIDIQYIVTGEEVLGWAPSEHMTITETYEADKDFCFGTVPPGKWTPVYLPAGRLVVLWPDDGHAPKLAAGTPSAVMKIVVKVAV
jgi:biofilm protein TabA